MIKTTPKQEAFCLAYLETTNATEAYRRAYDCSNMKLESIYRKAVECLDNGTIAARLEELRRPVAEAAQITLEGHLAELGRLRDAAAEDGKYAAAVTAEVSRGKAAGLYVEKVDITHRLGEMSDDDIRAELALLGSTV